MQPTGNRLSVLPSSGLESPRAQLGWCRQLDGAERWGLPTQGGKVLAGPVNDHPAGLGHGAQLSPTKPIAVPMGMPRRRELACGNRTGEIALRDGFVLLVGVGRPGDDTLRKVHWEGTQSITPGGEDAVLARARRAHDNEQPFAARNEGQGDHGASGMR